MGLAGNEKVCWDDISLYGLLLCGYVLAGYTKLYLSLVLERLVPGKTSKIETTICQLIDRLKSKYHLQHHLSSNSRTNS